MGKFVRLSGYDQTRIPEFKRKLRNKGFKNAYLSSFESHRMEHPTRGKIIIYGGYARGGKINENGFKWWCELMGEVE